MSSPDQPVPALQKYSVSATHSTETMPIGMRSDSEAYVAGTKYYFENRLRLVR